LLGSAGRRAFARDDMPAALKLLDRAVSLVTGDDPSRLELTRGLSSASWSTGELGRAEALLNEIVEQAVAVGDRRLEWYALLERAARRTQADFAAGTDELIRVAEQAVAVFEELGDDLGLARAWRRVSWARRLLHQFGPAAEAGELAVLHARQAGDPAEESRIVDGLCTCLLFGPAAVADAVRRCEAMLAEVGENRLTAAYVLAPLAGLEAMRGRFEVARSHVSAARAIYDDLGLQLALAGLTQVAGPLELLAGEPRRAEDELRRGLAILENVGGRDMLALQSALLAEALYAQDRLDEARELVVTSQDSAAPDFVGVQVRWRVVSAKLATAARENGSRALELAREATRLAARTDAPNLTADAHVALADALRAGSHQAEATAALREALRLYEGKGNLVSAARTRTRLFGVGAGATVQPGARALSSAAPSDTGR
jgi:tetratricopeptide (TPR) repeat protein